MRRGAAMPDWRSGLLGYVEVDEGELRRFAEGARLCGAPPITPRNLPCLKAMAGRVEFRAVLYLADVYGIASREALASGRRRDALLEAAWALLSSRICGGGQVECDGEVGLACCGPCGDACLLAAVAALAGLGERVDLRGELRDAIGRR